MTMATSDAQSWIRRFHQTPATTPRLVCLPHAGGSASYYFPFSAALAPAAQVLAVQYPGRQDRRNDPSLSTVPELAEAIFGALTDVPDLGEFALFGHSMGAVLAFEVAALLERRLGIQPVRLFVSGRRAPSRVRHERAHTLNDDGLVAELTTLDGTDSRLLADPEMRELLLPMIRSDYRAIETYRCDPGATVSCPISVLTGDADPRTSIDEALDWRQHTSADFTIREFSGGHFFLNDHQAEIVECVTRATGW
ncbi:alpha/beta fold hydrolase [Streptomyces sp. NBC_00247]|uniref:thioesterase II family protein n=1 Tax=Streptomyces sp. NBC_00247 TaxID=2975689 RepID=UPI002E29B463|nr:alpha/beta fold hydrolase [Streptomyces sp. NBC_00247]